MKTKKQKMIKNTILALVLLNSSLALSEVNSPLWVNTPFWKAPQLSEMALKVDATQPELIAACDLYRDLIVKVETQGMYPGLPKKIDRWRKTILPGSPINVSEFLGTFEFKNALNTNFEEIIDLSETMTIDENKEPLPLFTHLKATTGVSMNEVQEFKVEYIEGKHSLTKFSRGLGLSDSEIMSEISLNGNTVLQILGRDVACDLLLGNIKLTAKAPSYVSLEKADVLELENFYHRKLTPELNRILPPLRESAIIKSARLGYQMGRIIEEELHQKSMEVTETQIKGLFDVLFVTKTLDSSVNLIENNKKRVVNLVSSSEGSPVSINISHE